MFPVLEGLLKLVPLDIGGGNVAGFVMTSNRYKEEQVQVHVNQSNLDISVVAGGEVLLRMTFVMIGC